MELYVDRVEIMMAYYGVYSLLVSAFTWDEWWVQNTANRWATVSWVCIMVRYMGARSV